jgi:tetratricopeptide (TPR) repeat protein
MTKRVLIGAGVATVAAVLFWPRHPQKDAPIEASGPGATVRRPARQEITEEKRRHVAELGVLMRAVVRADQARGERERKQTAVVKQAKDRFEVATKAYEQERFIDAVEGFRDAYELVPHPDFLYNAGMSYQRARNCREANFYFDWYLEERPKLLETEDPRIADTTPSLSSRMAFALDAIRAPCR